MPFSATALRAPFRAYWCVLALASAMSAAGCATTSTATATEPEGAATTVATGPSASEAADHMDAPGITGIAQNEAVTGSHGSQAIGTDDTAATTMRGNNPVAGVPPGSTDLQTGPTQAEADFDALYGGQAYNPVADSRLPAPAQMPGVYDPWERYNRKMHTFNNVVDRTIARPLALFYVAVTPRPIRLGVSNFFNNLGQPVSAVNALLQGKPVQAGHSLGRFLLNSTLGIGGIFDPASDAELDRRSEDFGQTLGTWGWARSRYVELPLFGPRTVRDVFGMVGDAPLSPLRQVEEDAVRIPLQGLQLVDVRTQLLPTDSLREGVTDDYALVRDAWTQRRDYQIFGDRMNDDDDQSLPDYLRDDSNPLVPAGAMPVMPTDN
ncbi:MAG: VacJ family lipoprotein [Lysobacter sp.]